jgi:hypothetical protein
MVALSSLLLPILLSAVAVFILGFLIHMLLKYHANDFPAVPDQDAVMDAMRKFNIAPGDYMMPRAADMKEMKTPAFEEKFKKGPVIWMTVLPNGSMGMGKYMVQWFIYCLVVGAFTAFVVSRTQGPGGEQVMLLASVVSFMGYSLAYWPSSIWYRRKWSTTIKNTFDGALSGIVTGAVFALMWPKG